MPVNGMSALVKGTSESSPAPSTTQGHSEKSVVCPPEEGPPTVQPLRRSDVRPLDSRIEKYISVVLRYLIYGSLLQQPELRINICN